MLRRSVIGKIWRDPMALVCFSYLVVERMFEMYEAAWLSLTRAPEPTIIMLEEEPPEPVAIAA
jgi:hypothetical protein